MPMQTIIDTLSSVELIVCALSLGVLLYRRQFGSYPYLCLFIAVRLFADVVLGVLIVSSHHVQAKAASSYWTYFYVYWATYTLEAILLILTVYGIYRLAMVPLPGLQRLGMLVFRWAAAISLAVSVGLAFGPHVTSLRYVIRLITQMQQTSSILTLCLLLFVCFAIRPMGLTYRSRIFGVSLGLGLLAVTNLITSGWIVSTKNMYSPLSAATCFAVCAAFVVWAVYFVLPEPRRVLIVLPTTSPFLRWNQISQALGDAPGYVAVGGIPPEMFADAEIEIMKRASRKMIEQPEPALGTQR